MSATHLNYQFSPLRVFWLIKNRTTRDLVPLGIGAAILFGLNLLSILFTKTAIFNEPRAQIFSFVIALVCLLMASNAFQDMHSGKSGTDWLLFPANPFEKYLATLAQYLLVLPVLTVAGVTAISALSGLIAWLAGGSTGSIFNPIQWNPELLGISLTGLLVFIAGSATFRKHALLKTLGMMIAWGLAVVLLLSFGTWFILKTGGRLGTEGFDLVANHNSFGWVVKNIPHSMIDIPNIAVQVFFYVVTPLAALPYTYYKIREKEAQDAVQ